MDIIATGTTTERQARRDAVMAFLDTLAAHSARIQRSRRITDQIYAFQTPDRPFVQFDVEGYRYAQSSWVESPRDKLLDDNMQRIAYQLTSLPESDFVPLLSPGNTTSAFIPSMFGGEFNFPPGGGVLAKFNVINDLEQDLPRLAQPDVSRTDGGSLILENVRFLAEVTERQVPIAYPQMQGFLTVAARLMDQAEMLMACRTAPELLRELSHRIARAMIEMVKALQAAVGPDVLRPRQRFHQPDWVHGLIIDDYISVIRPDDYDAICSSSWQMIFMALGPIYFHTCGPVALCRDVLARLPGLVGFETAFVPDRSKTTHELSELKSFFQGRAVVDSTRLPFGEAVSDPENLTASWLRSISMGGGFMLNAAGSAQEGRQLLAKLGLL